MEMQKHKKPLSILPDGEISYCYNVMWKTIVECLYSL